MNNNDEEQLYLPPPVLDQVPDIFDVSDREETMHEQSSTVEPNQMNSEPEVPSSLQTGNIRADDQIEESLNPVPEMADLILSSGPSAATIMYLEQTCAQFHLKMMKEKARQKAMKKRKAKRARKDTIWTTGPISLPDRPFPEEAPPIYSPDIKERIPNSGESFSARPAVPKALITALKFQKSDRRLNCPYYHDALKPCYHSSEALEWITRETHFSDVLDAFHEAHGLQKLDIDLKSLDSPSIIIELNLLANGPNAIFPQDGQVSKCTIISRYIGLILPDIPTNIGFMLWTVQPTEIELIKKVREWGVQTQQMLAFIYSQEKKEQEQEEALQAIKDDCMKGIDSDYERDNLWKHGRCDYQPRRKIFDFEPVGKDFDSFSSYDSLLSYCQAPSPFYLHKMQDSSAVEEKPEPEIEPKFNFNHLGQVIELDKNADALEPLLIPPPSSRELSREEELKDQGNHCFEFIPPELPSLSSTPWPDKKDVLSERPPKHDPSWYRARMFERHREELLERQNRSGDQSFQVPSARELQEEVTRFSKRQPLRNPGIIKKLTDADQNNTFDYQHFSLQDPSQAKPSETEDVEMQSTEPTLATGSTEPSTAPLTESTNPSPSKAKQVRNKEAEALLSKFPSTSIAAALIRQRFGLNKAPEKSSSEVPPPGTSMAAAGAAPESSSGVQREATPEKLGTDEPNSIMNSAYYPPDLQQLLQDNSKSAADVKKYLVRKHASATKKKSSKQQQEAPFSFQAQPEPSEVTGEDIIISEDEADFKQALKDETAIEEAADESTVLSEAPKPDGNLIGAPDSTQQPQPVGPPQASPKATPKKRKRMLNPFPIAASKLDQTKMLPPIVQLDSTYPIIFSPAPAGILNLFTAENLSNEKEFMFHIGPFLQKEKSFVVDLLSVDKGGQVDENKPMPAPRFLPKDYLREFVLRKMQRHAMIMGFKIKMPYSDRVDKTLTVRTVNFYCHKSKSANRKSPSNDCPFRVVMKIQLQFLKASVDKWLADKPGERSLQNLTPVGKEPSEDLKALVLAIPWNEVLNIHKVQWLHNHHMTDYRQMKQERFRNNPLKAKVQQLITEWIRSEILTPSYSKTFTRAKKARMKKKIKEGEQQTAEEITPMDLIPVIDESKWSEFTVSIDPYFKCPPEALQNELRSSFEALIQRSDFSKIRNVLTGQPQSVSTKPPIEEEQIENTSEETGSSALENIVDSSFESGATESFNHLHQPSSLLSPVEHEEPDQTMESEPTFAEPSATATDATMQEFQSFLEKEQASKGDDEMAQGQAVQESPT